MTSIDLAPSRRGRILLVGSGPGHPSLPTVATHAELTKHADLVLSDKLVPEAVLALVPPGVEVRMARKFPGDAEGAQMELMEAAIEAANRGLTVVRVGVSSVLAGPTFAGIPVTRRGATESFIVCTGVGRQGQEVKLPGYERGRTLVWSGHCISLAADRLQGVPVLSTPNISRRRFSDPNGERGNTHEVLRGHRPNKCGML